MEEEGGEGSDREKVSPPLPLCPTTPNHLDPHPLLTVNRCVWVSPCGCSPGRLKGEPKRASPFLQRGYRRTSSPKPGRLASHRRTLHLSAELSLPISPSTTPPHTRTHLLPSASNIPSLEKPQRILLYTHSSLY